MKKTLGTLLAAPLLATALSAQNPTSTIRQRIVKEEPVSCPTGDAFYLRAHLRENGKTIVTAPLTRDNGYQFQFPVDTTKPNAVWEFAATPLEGYGLQMHPITPANANAATILEDRRIDQQELLAAARDNKSIEALVKGTITKSIGGKEKTVDCEQIVKLIPYVPQGKLVEVPVPTPVPGINTEVSHPVYIGAAGLPAVKVVRGGLGAHLRQYSAEMPLLDGKNNIVLGRALNDFKRGYLAKAELEQRDKEWHVFAVGELMNGKFRTQGAICDDIIGAHAYHIGVEAFKTLFGPLAFGATVNYEHLTGKTPLTFSDSTLRELRQTDLSAVAAVAYVRPAVVLSLGVGQARATDTYPEQNVRGIVYQAGMRATNDVVGKRLILSGNAGVQWRELDGQGEMRGYMATAGGNIERKLTDMTGIYIDGQFTHQRWDQGSEKYTAQKKPVDWRATGGIAIHF